MKVIFLRAARRDLATITRFIAQDNPPRAVSFVSALEEVALRIGGAPRGFPLVPRYEQQGIRRRSWRGYGILYALRNDSIAILRILGPGQDHDRLLGLK
ncbi:MAG: type II toxin-antitoxin system RelE/ParE family toxin [Novosphingobium sp.]|nr:type II toxin-antitoxin system RelE/ParE family toxin [Novosphingobium sp.]